MRDKLLYVLSVCTLWGLSAFTPPVPLSRISGTVRDAQGTSLAGVRIGILDPATAAMFETTTDSEGRFECSNLSSARAYRLVLAKFGFETVTLDSIVPDKENLIVSMNRTALPVGSVAAPARSADVPAESKQIPVFRAGVNWVVVNASVKDAQGQPAAGLPRSAFAIYDDGTRREIVDFQEQRSPASIVLLLDVSSSMEGKPLLEAQKAAVEFIRQCDPLNEIALMAFNDRLRIAQNFTVDHAEVQQAVERLRASGGTALYDAVARSLNYLETARHPSKFLVLLSDGQDEDSGRRFSDLQRQVAASNTVIYALGYYATGASLPTGVKYYKAPEIEENLNPVWVLTQFGESTGGHALFPKGVQELTPLFSWVADELKNTYTLAFIPEEPSEQASKFHRLEVRLTSPDVSRPLQIRARQGYFDKSPIPH